MKSFITAIVIITALIVFSIGGTVLTDKTLLWLDDEISAMPIGDVTDYDAVYEDILKIEEKYEKADEILALLLTNIDLEKIKSCIDEIKVGAQIEDEMLIKTAKSRLLLHTEQLRRLSGFSMDSIF